MGEFDYIVDETFEQGGQWATVSPGEFDYLVDETFAEPVRGDQKPTGRFSTITCQPIYEPDLSAPDFPGFGTLTKAALVDDPQTKINIFAEARGLSPDRYQTMPDGKLVFRDDQGVLRYEAESSLPTNKMKGLVANVAGKPSIPMAAVGATTGPWGAVAGGAGGEAWRKVAANVFLDEPQTTKENLLDIGSEGLLALLAEFGTRGLVGSVNKALGIGKPGGRTLRGAAKADYQNLDMQQVADIRAKGKEFGIDLFSPQTTKSRELIAKMNLLRDLPQTSDIIQAADTLQNEQIQAAVPKFLDSITHAGATSRAVGQKLKDTAEKAVVGLKADRAKVTSPIYKAAFKENPTVQVDDILTFIDDKLQFAKADERRALLKLKKDVVDPVMKEEASTILGPDGTPARKASEEMSATLRGLHGLKMSLDKKIASINKPGSKSIDNIIGGEMKVVRSMVLDAMDQASPTYAGARQMHALLSPDVDLAEKGLTGVLAKAAEGDGLVKLSGTLLHSSITRPETVRAVRRQILKQSGGQKVWGQAVREYLEHTFESIPESQLGSLNNIGGAFRKRVFGTVKQRRIMKEALGDKYQNMVDFMDVLERTGLTFGRESTTAIRQQAIEDLKRESVPSAVQVMNTPMQTPRIVLGAKLQDIFYGRGATKLAEALVDERAATELATLKALKPGSEGLVKGVAEFLELSAVKEIERDAERLLAQ